MADVLVTREVLTATIESLEEALVFLKAAVETIDALYPEGFTLVKGPAINDGMVAIVEFASGVNERIKVRRMEGIFGPASKTKRKARGKKA